MSNCATRCTQYGSDFAVNMRANDIHITIKRNKIILMLFKNTTKNIHKKIVLIIPRKKIEFNRNRIRPQILSNIKHREKIRREYIRINVPGIDTINPFLVSLVMGKV